MRAIPVAVFVTTHDPLPRIVFIVLCLLGVITGVFKILKKQTGAWQSFVKAVVYGIGGAVIAAGITLDRMQADALVSKVEAYKQLQGRYPEKLDKLAPKQMPEIPQIGQGRVYADQSCSVKPFAQRL